MSLRTRPVLPLPLSRGIDRVVERAEPLAPLPGDSLIAPAEPIPTARLDKLFPTDNCDTYLARALEPPPSAEPFRAQMGPGLLRLRRQLEQLRNARPEATAQCAAAIDIVDQRIALHELLARNLNALHQG